MKLLEKLKNLFKKINCTKLALGFILINCMAMMWFSYILAWFDRITIAETLSSTVADVIVGTIVAYLCTKTIENISKYGSRLNHTTREQENLNAPDKDIEIINLSSKKEGDE